MKLEPSSRQERVGGSLHRKVAAELGESNRFAQPSRGAAANEVGVNSVWWRLVVSKRSPDSCLGNDRRMLGWQCETDCPRPSLARLPLPGSL